MQCRTAAGLAYGDAIFAGHILEKRLQVDLLLILAADGGRRRLADDSDDRLVVHLRVIQAVEQMNRTGAAGGHADPDGAGKLGVCRCHERGEFLVSCLNESRLILVLTQAGKQSVNAVARKSINPLDTPLFHALHNILADADCHDSSFLVLKVVKMRISFEDDKCQFRFALKTFSLRVPSHPCAGPRKVR